MDNKEIENNKLKISDTIFIFAITVFTYALSYNYDLGYKAFYNIPELFTEVSTQKLIMSLLKIISSLIPVLLIINSAPEFMPKSPLLNGFFFMILSGIIPMLVVGLNKTTVIPFFVATIFILIFEVFIPLVATPKIKGIKNKIEASQEEYSRYKSLVSIIGKKYRIILIAMLVYALFIPLAKQIGERDAAKQVKYLVANDTKNKYIVIDKNDDKYIVIPVDISSKTFTSKFKIIDLNTDDSKDIECEWMVVGPLKLKR